MKRAWFALAVVTAGLILMGTSSIAGAGESSTLADEAQARQIWTRLREAPHLENNRIVVDVYDGIAVLEGTVDSADEKKEAQQLAHVDGILGVNNRLRVHPSER